MSLVACVALCFAASAQKQWHQDLINTASASPSADVNAVVNRDNMTGRIKTHATAYIFSLHRPKTCVDGLSLIRRRPACIRSTPKNW